MSSTDDIPLLERPAFFDGQRLMAYDLAATQTYNRELRWLHNRSLHGWGIAFGFAIAGTRGVQSVKVDIGYAIDRIGRDLILDAPVEMPIPSVASASDVVACQMGRDGSRGRSWNASVRPGVAPLNLSQTSSPTLNVVSGVASNSVVAETPELLTALAGATSGIPLQRPGWSNSPAWSALVSSATTDGG